jgi:mycothiol system anti-sigma-R factor
VSDEHGTDPVETIDPSCAAVGSKVWTLLDGECTAEVSETILHHFDEYPDCLSYFRLEARIKLLISTKCVGDKAPKRLGRRRLCE